MAHPVIVVGTYDNRHRAELDYEHIAKNREELWSERIYAIDEAGKCSLFAASPEKFQPLAENQIGTEAFATPTIVGGRIYLRVAEMKDGQRQEMLYCLGRK